MEYVGENISSHCSVQICIAPKEEKCFYSKAAEKQKT